MVKRNRSWKQASNPAPLKRVEKLPFGPCTRYVVSLFILDTAVNISATSSVMKSMCYRWNESYKKWIDAGRAARHQCNWRNSYTKTTKIAMCLDGSGVNRLIKLGALNKLQLTAAWKVAMRHSEELPWRSLPRLSSWALFRVCVMAMEDRDIKTSLRLLPRKCPLPTCYRKLWRRLLRLLAPSHPAYQETLPLWQNTSF